MSLSHPFVQEQLQSGQRLSPAAQAALDEHLAACPECQAYAAFHQSLLETLPHRNPAPRHSEREIRERINRVSAKLEQRRWPARIFQNTFSLAGVAAALVLLLVVLIYLPRMLPEQSVFAPVTTQALAGVPYSNPNPTIAPITQPTAAPSLPFLPVLPFSPGTTWEYTKTGYAQADGEPQKIIHGTAKIEERIADVQSQPPNILVHIQGNKSLVSADPGWQENGAFGLGDYEYWYLIKDNQVYLSYTRPDLTHIKFDPMLLAYQFPLIQGSEWCLSSLRTGTVENPTPDPNSPCESRRIVTGVFKLALPNGVSRSCYEIHDVANSGDVITQFCDGVGIQSIKYRHAGSQFGFEQDLTRFTNGKDDSKQLMPAPTVSQTAEPGLNRLEQSPLPDGRGTGLVQTQSGQNRPVPAVAIQGQTAYLGAGSHLAAIDISQPAAPKLAGQSAELPGPVLKVIPLPNAPSPRVAASAGRYLVLLYTSAPDELSLVTQSKLPGLITALILDINTNRIYAGGTRDGNPTQGFLAILDTTQPDMLDLRDTIQLAAPVRSLALAKSVLYASHNDSQPGVTAIALNGDSFNAPVEALSVGMPIYSMTTAGDTLYVGSDRLFSAYRLTDPLHPQAAWNLGKLGDPPFPGPLLGFELRANAIYTAGIDPTGKPFRLAIPPPEPIKASSMVDTASYIAVANGQMLVASSGLEIYDIRDPQNIQRLGSYPLASP